LDCLWRKKTRNQNRSLLLTNDFNRCFFFNGDHERRNVRSGCSDSKNRNGTGSDSTSEGNTVWASRVCVYRECSTRNEIDRTTGSWACGLEFWSSIKRVSAFCPHDRKRHH